MRRIPPLRSARLTESEARLLRSARLDVPTRGAKGRLLGALGLAAGVTAAAGTTGVASAAVPLLVAKWVVIGVVSTTAAVGGLVTWQHRANEIGEPRADAGSHPKASLPSVAEARPGAPVAPVPPSRSAEPVEESPSVLAPPTAPQDLRLASPLPMPPPVRSIDGQPPSSGTRPRPPATSEPSEHPPASGPLPIARGELEGSREAPHASMGDELMYLDAAREALARSDPAAALQAIDAYHERVARPRFEEEATVLRIDALVASGRSDSARGLGERYLALHPESAYAQHMRSILRLADAGSSNP